MSTGTFIKKSFVMDALTPEGFIGPFEGWTDGEFWNGWAMPFYDRDTASEVAKAVSLTGRKGSYDADRDAFDFQDPNNPDDVETFVGMEIETGSGSHHVYPIGSGSWIWEYGEE
jgi:hypothetical protein